MSKWPSDNDKEVWYNHKDKVWYNTEGEVCELYSGVDHDGTKYSFFTNQAYWDCECDENYIHKKTEQKRCTKCDTFHEDQPDSRQHEIDSFVTDKVVRYIDNEERIASTLEERRKTLQRLAENKEEKNAHLLDKAFERLAEDRELYASENKEPKRNLWSVNLEAKFKNILFDCEENEIERHVQDFIISEMENFDWTYEKADVNVDKTMIRS